MESVSDLVRPGCVAVFLANSEQSEEEELEVVFEVRKAGELSSDDFEALMKSIHQNIAGDFGIRGHRLVAIEERSIPKTSSGKIQRRATREALHTGALKVCYQKNYHPHGDSPCHREESKSAVPSFVDTPDGGPISVLYQELLAAAEKRERFRSNLQRYVSHVIRSALPETVGLEGIDEDTSLFEMGLDSMLFPLLLERLSMSIGGLELSADIIFTYPTLRSLSGYVTRRLLKGDSCSGAEYGTIELFRSDEALQADGQIAVVGMACRFPGSEGRLSGFWELLVSMKSGISEIPYERFDDDKWCDSTSDGVNKPYVRHGAFLERIDHFAAKVFGISRQEALMMDPQQRLLLEIAYEAFHTAGHSRGTLAGYDAGVFVGISSTDWRVVSKDTVDAYSATGHAQSIAANRISYTLGLTGPSVSMDTACSSSLVAVDIACESLRLGKCDLALVAGVNLMLDSRTFLALCKAQMLSKDGRCKAFDSSADGYVRGEGCGAVVLKRLSDAEALGSKDIILAVIRGIAVNQDGRSAVLTAPKGSAQEVVIRRALHEARVTGRDISCVVAHGTGTIFGDAIEVGALKAVYGPRCAGDHPLIVTSVKPNIGHLEAAAGIANLIASVLILQYGEAPGILHFKNLNRYIDIKGFEGLFPVETTELFAGGLFVGCSSFGFGGTNVHVVLERTKRGTIRNLPSVEGLFEQEVFPWHTIRDEEGGDSRMEHRIEYLGISKDPVLSKAVELAEGVLHKSLVPSSSLMAAGMSSLQAVRYINELSWEFRVDLPFTLIIELPVISDTVAFIHQLLGDAEARQAGSGTIPPRIMKIDDSGYEELIASWQQEQWFTQDHLVQTQFDHHIPMILELERSIDISALRYTLSCILSRHEILRTTLGLGADRILYQRIHHMDYDVDRILTLRQVSRDESGEDLEDGISRAAKRTILEAIHAPFDLSNGPLWRVMVFTLTGIRNREFLVLNAHHAIMDGWSAGQILRDELISTYTATACAGDKGLQLLPGLKLQYADYALWQRKNNGGETGLSYWIDQLSNYTPLEMPIDHPRPRTFTGLGAIVPVRIPSDVLLRLRSLCGSKSCSLFTGLLCVFQLLLARYSGNALDVCVGTPHANRNRPETANLLGCFINIIAVRTDMRGEPNFLDLLSRVQQVLLAAMRHVETPFPEVVRALRRAGQLNEDASRNPVFQSFFALQEPASRPGRLFTGPNGFKIIYHGNGSSWSPDSCSARCDLAMELFENDDASIQDMEGYVEYNRSLFDRETIERFVVHFITLMQSCIARPCETIWCLDMLPTNEKSLLLEEWSGSQRVLLLPEKLLHQLFEDQAERLPMGAVAIEEYESGRVLTYRELNHSADVVKGTLVDLGVHNDCHVGILIPRCAEAIIAIYGVMKAGGAYVPMEVDYPFSQVSAKEFKSHNVEIISL